MTEADNDEPLINYLKKKKKKKKKFGETRVNLLDKVRKYKAKNNEVVKAIEEMK